jgi:hypothetical protein
LVYYTHTPWCSSYTSSVCRWVTKLTDDLKLQRGFP